jgi:hypothetical protein
MVAKEVLNDLVPDEMDSAALESSRVALDPKMESYDDGGLASLSKMSSMFGKSMRGPRNVETGVRYACSVIGPSKYYIGLIDILQEWDMSKKMERFAKTQLLQKDKDGLSAIPCEPYQERFMEKMKVLLGIDQGASSSGNFSSMVS